MNNPADTLAALAADIERAGQTAPFILDNTAFAISPSEIDGWVSRLRALASLKGEAVGWQYRSCADMSGRPLPENERGRWMQADEYIVACRETTPAWEFRQIYTTPPAPQAGLFAWVSEMNTSAATEYWVCVGWGRNFGEYMTVRMSHMRNRSELEVAEWNHLFGKGTKPCIADPKFRDPEQVSSMPSPAPQGGGELHVRHIGGGLLSLYRGDEQVREIGVTPGWDFRDRDEFIARYNATPPAQQPGEVVTNEMVERAASILWSRCRLGSCSEASPHQKFGFMEDARAVLTAALAPKEKGNA